MARGSRKVADPATAYAESVLEGRIIAGPHVRAACRRHLQDLVEGSKRGLVWKIETADRVARYFRSVLRLAGGEHEGKPFDLLPWEEFVGGSLFGWYRTEGVRRFRVAFIETAKGSGKSPFAAGIGMYGLHADGEARAEIYAAATKKDQAQVLFRDAVAMVRQSPALTSRLTMSGGNPVWNIADLGSGSFFRPISSEDQGQHGPRPHFALIDEVHEHKNDVIIEAMRAGFKGRRQPLMFMITNSGVDRTSVCYRYHEYGTKVAAGDLEDDSFFAYICAVDEDEDPFTDPVEPELGYPRSWAKTNPSIGVTFQPSYLEEQIHQARGMPAKESIVRRLNFCQWVGAENPWIGGDLWRACEVGELPAGEGEEFLGLDLSSKHDLTAAARVRQTPSGPVGEVRFWTPADTMEERERRDRVPYTAWVRSGHLIAVPGRVVNYDFVVRDLITAGWLKTPSGLAFDQWRIDDFQRALDDAGIDNWIWDPPQKVYGSGVRLVRHGQGWQGGKVDIDPKTGEPMPKTTLWMPRSIGATEDVITQGKLRVLRNPCLTHASASAITAQDPAGNKKWEKRKSTGRIDGIVALSMAIGLAEAELPKVPEFRVMFIGG